MQYDVLLYESNRLMLSKLSNVIKNTKGFKLVAKYQNHQDALGQGTVFNPNLILLDVENASSINLIRDFHRSYPQASIICIGEQWQGDKAIHFVQAGAKGYLLKPFSSEELLEAVKTFALGGMKSDCTVMSFFSPKGKSGKTTLIANLAIVLANMTGDSVGIIDADLQFGDMSVFFDLNPKSTIVEATRDTAFLSPVTLGSYFVPVTNKVSLLCGTKNPSLIDKVAIKDLEAVVTMAKSLYRYILIDIPAGFNPTSISMAELSDITYIVSMRNGGFEIEHMKSALEIFKDWPDVEQRLKPIFTRVNPYNESSRLELSHLLDFNVDAIVPNEYMMVSAAANNGNMAMSLTPESKMAQSINVIAKNIIERK